MSKFWFDSIKIAMTQRKTYLTFLQPSQVYPGKAMQILRDFQNINAKFVTHLINWINHQFSHVYSK